MREEYIKLTGRKDRRKHVWHRLSNSSEEQTRCGQRFVWFDVSAPVRVFAVAMQPKGHHCPECFEQSWPERVSTAKG